MKNVIPLHPETYYHIYNRGINGETIFKHDRNYSYFLLKYDKYISPIADTYAYCFLKNDFHFLIRMKSEDEIFASLKPVRILNPDRAISKIVSSQFSHFFNGYSQAINKENDRTGKLLELPFRRIAVTNDAYFSALVYYIHSNPQKHRLIDDFREWPHSSYQSHLVDRPTKLSRDEVLEWFGNRKAYLDFHSSFQDIRGIHPLLFD